MNKKWKTKGKIKYESIDIFILNCLIIYRKETGRKML